MIKVITQDITDGFQWKTTEQVWPFERDSSGNMLYCKEVDFGALPNAGIKTVSIGSTDSLKIYRAWGIATWNSGTKYQEDTVNLPFVASGATWMITLNMGATGVSINVAQNYSGYNGKIYLLYYK